jgi:hypothetical protein
MPNHQIVDVAEEAEDRVAEAEDGVANLKSFKVREHSQWV